MRGQIGAIPVPRSSRCCSTRIVAALFVIGLLPPAPALARYAEEWHEPHGQQWGGGPGWSSLPAEPALSYQYGSGYPVAGYYYPDHSYGSYPYRLQPFPYGYSAGFSDGFAAGYDHGVTGGLNNAFANGYASESGYGAYYGYPYPYHGY
jgi:hypothetical protein